MDDLFIIGKARFEFAADSAVVFAEGGMRFDLRGLCQPFDKRLHDKAFEADAAPGFSTSSIFHFYDRTDEPRRVVDYPQDQPAAHDFHFFESGFVFGLRFHGRIDIGIDRVEIEGTLRKSYEQDHEGTPVHVLRHFAPGVVELKPHTYTSLEEAESVDPARVRRMLWRQPWSSADAERFDAFPAGLLRFTRLEFLSMQFASQQHGNFTTLPDGFCDLSELRAFYIAHTRLQTLPERLGALRHLRELSVTRAALNALPDSVGELKNLERLVLTGNALKTLPASVGELPALRFLGIADNAFEWLPASLANIHQVKVEKRVEALFRDIRYRPDVQADLDPRPRQPLRCRTTQPDDGAVPGRTRFGGAPDLPPGIDYPMTDGRHWHFLAQIDLEAIAALQHWLPREGRLYFFIEGQERGGGVRVLHSTAPASALRTCAWPRAMEFVDGDNVPEPYAAFQAEFEPADATPPDDDAHTLGAQVFTQGDSPEEQAARAKGGLPAEWINLLSVASDPRPGFNFWDAGTFTFSIHQKDLALGDFSRVHDSLESS